MILGRNAWAIGKASTFCPVSLYPSLLISALSSWPTKDPPLGRYLVTAAKSITPIMPREMEAMMTECSSFFFVLRAIPLRAKDLGLQKENEEEVEKGCVMARNPV
ncbi:uncharacterized [Tachysurus ichikawai]